MKSFSMTDTGIMREMNQDDYFLSETPVGNLPNLFIVADGMGGHKAGEVASNIAIEHIRDSFEKINTLGKKEDAIEWLRNIVKEINERIFSYTSEHPESRGMGTTLVVSIVRLDLIESGEIFFSCSFHN